MNDDSIQATRDLFKAARLGHLQTLRRALAVLGPSSVDGANKSPAFAALKPNQAAALRLILQNGADPLEANAKGQPLAWAAAQAGSRECLEALSQAGAPLGQPGRPCADPRGLTPLMAAAARAKAQALRWLIDAGCELDALDHGGASAAMFAAGAGREEALRVLIQAGANLGLRDRDGADAARWAWRAGNALCAALCEEALLGSLAGAPKKALPKAL